MRSFAKIIPLRNREITLSMTDVGKSNSSREFTCLLTGIRENKIPAKISELTVYASSEGSEVKMK